MKTFGYLAFQSHQSHLLGLEHKGVREDELAMEGGGGDGSILTDLALSVAPLLSLLLILKQFSDQRHTRTEACKVRRTPVEQDSAPPPPA
jgi:hypothetical protein